MSVNGISGEASNVLYQKMLKAAQTQKAGGERGQNEALAKSSGGGKPEMTKVTRNDEKSPRELAEEMQRVAQKRQDAQPMRMRAASPAVSAGGGSATNRTTAQYKQSLQESFPFMNNCTTIDGIPTTVTVSSAFIAKCADDPEKAKYLEENLAAVPECTKYLRDTCPGLTDVAVEIDGNGDIAVTAYNWDDGKNAAENAKKKAQENMDKTEEMLKKLKEKRAEQKESEAKAAEKGSSGSLTEKLTVRVAEKFELARNGGTDIAAGVGQQLTISETGSFTSEDGPIGGKIDSYS